MDDDLVLLTSYFNLANGRRQDTADTFRVDPSLPSKTSPDGTAALYIVTEASAAGHMGPRARRLAADTVAWEYSQRGDEQPAPRLRAALRAAHQEVVREFDGHVSVGVSVVAVEHDQVFLAQVAPAQVYVLHEGSLHSISANVSSSSPFAHALGAAGSPEISVFRDEVGPGDVIALCSSWFNRSADADNLRESFGAGAAEEIAEALYELAKEHGVRDASCIIIDAVRAKDIDEVDESAPRSFMEQVDMAVQALAGVGRMFLSELRPAADPGERNGSRSSAPGRAGDARAPAGAPDAVTGEPDELTSEVPHIEPGPPRPVAGETAGGHWNPEDTHAFDLGEVNAPGPADRADHQSTRDQTRQPEPSAPAEPVAADQDAESYHRSPFRDRKGAPEPVAEPQSPSHSEMDVVNARLQTEPDLGEDVIPPVQAFPDTSTQPSRIYATDHRDMQAANKRPRRFGGVSRPSHDVGGSSPVLRPGLGDFDVRQRMSRQAPPTVIWGGAAALAVLVLLAIIIFLSRGHGGGTPAVTNPYPQRFATDLRLLRTAVLPAQQNAEIAQARKDIALAQQFGTTASKIAFFKVELQQTIDTVDKVTRVTAPAVAADFSKIAGSTPKLMASGSANIFVLDSGKKAVYSLTPGAAGTSSPTQIVAAGASENGTQVGTPVQLATAGPTALVLDDADNLVLDNSGTITAIALQKASPAQQVTAMVDNGSDVYLLDAVGSQIWEYAGAATGVGNGPIPVFSSPVHLDQAVSLTNDDTALYIMMKNGTVQKYDYHGAKQAFSAPALRVPLQNPDSVFTDAGLNYVWIADPANNRVIQVGKTTGKYCGAYEPGTVAGKPSMDLTQATAVIVPPDGKHVYVLSGKVVYDFPVVAPKGCS